MKTLILFVSLLLPVTSLAALNAYLKMEGQTQDKAMDQARKGYDYYKARGAETIKVNTDRPRSSDKRKQSLYFPEEMSGFYLSPDNELLHIRRGKLVKRMKVRPSVKKRALPEVDDEVLTSKKKLPVKKKKPHK